MSDTFDAPGSRNEAILQNMLGANNPLEPPSSRIEDLLQQLLENGSGSGLPDVTGADNGKVLGVENGAWGKMDAPSGLPDVTDADFGKVLKVTDVGAWGTGNNIHWLEGGSTYLPFTQALLDAVTNAIPVMLQNNYMSYTVTVILDSTVKSNVQSMAQEIIVALVDNELPIYRMTGIPGYFNTVCPLKYANFGPDGVSEGFDILTSNYIYYVIPEVGTFVANAEVIITGRDNTATMFIKFDRLEGGAHS